MVCNARPPRSPGTPRRSWASTPSSSTTPSPSTASSIEDTFDWYAQDRDGNVWYFGEATKEFKDDGTADTTGSFEGGVERRATRHHHAGPPAGRRSVPAGIRERSRRGHRRGAQPHRQRKPPRSPGRFRTCWSPKDSDLLDPAAPSENKYYAHGIGLILTLTGATEREEAVAVEKF